MAKGKKRRGNKPNHEDQNQVSSINQASKCNRILHYLGTMVKNKDKNEYK